MTTPDENLPQRVQRLESRVDELSTRVDGLDELKLKLNDIHNCLFHPPRPNKPALIDRTMAIVDAAEKSSFAWNLAIKIILTLGAVATAVAAIAKMLGIV